MAMIKCQHTVYTTPPAWSTSKPAMLPAFGSQYLTNLASWTELKRRVAASKSSSEQRKEEGGYKKTG